MSEAATLITADSTLTVSGALDFDSVLALQQQGAQWIQKIAPAPITLNLAGVTYSSSAGLALLLDWLRAAHRSGKQISVANMPVDMLALVRVSGLEQSLPLV